MIELTLQQVAEAVGGRVHGDPDLRITTVSTDTRTLDRARRALFVALPGETADGHDHVARARAAGATAVLVQRYDGDGPAVEVEDSWAAIAALGGAVRDRVGPDVVAITGSVGKTTTKDLTAAALRADRATVAAPGSFNNELGVPLTLLATAADTRALVVEMGARGIGHIAALTPVVRPDVAIVTAVAGAHLEQFGDLDTVARAKGELVEALTADGTAVLNHEDPRVAAMAERTDARVLGYGRGGDVHAAVVRFDERACARATVRTPWGEVALRLALPGRHNLDNALAALAAAGALGVPLDVAAAGLATAEVSRWRAELTERSDGVLVCNDAYNANPTAVAAALRMLGDLRRPGGRAVAVLGHMAELGTDEHDGHERVGTLAAASADIVVAVGDTGPLAAAARAAGADVLEVAGPHEVAPALAAHLGAADVVLVKASRSAGLELAVDALLTAPSSPGTPLEGQL